MEMIRLLTAMVIGIVAAMLFPDSLRKALLFVAVGLLVTSAIFVLSDRMIP